MDSVTGGRLISLTGGVLERRSCVLRGDSPINGQQLRFTIHDQARPGFVRFWQNLSMRILLAILVAMAPLTRLRACSCAGPGTPCSAAGSSAAVFTGTVVTIADPVYPLPIGSAGPSPGSRRPANRRSADDVNPLPRPLRVVRFQVGEVLSGVAPGQKEIEILTGMGSGDCGYPFRTGSEYVVYAYQNSEGRLETGICSRTRPLAQASEDIAYIRAMSNALETGEIRVRTGLADMPGKTAVTIIAEREGSRYSALTNAAGEALFTGLPPGDYIIHAESDGDLPDDPKVRLHAKGCLDVTLLRTLRIRGRVMTRSGLPAARAEVQLRSTEGKPVDGAMTGADGAYELRIVRPGQYYLGINLNHTPTQDTPYPRWFYPGTEDPASATRIDFSGKPEIRSYDLTLPDRQPERTIEGIVLNGDGLPRPRAVVTAFDASQTMVAQASADQAGRFVLHLFAGMPYRLLAVWPGNSPHEAASAVPIDIQPDSQPLSLRLTLTQPGNLFFEENRQGVGR